MSEQLPEWIGENQAANMLGVTPRTLRRMFLYDNTLARRLPGMVRRKYSTARLRALITEREQLPKP